MTPQAKRQAVLEMQSATAVSQRQACQLVGLARSTLRYEPRSSLADEQLQARIIELAQERRRFVYRRIHALLRREGYEINHKRTYRLYREASLAVRKRKPTQNAYIESFNGKFRDECLNEHWFRSLEHARAILCEW